MTILSWNCRGLGSSLAVRTLTDKVKARDPLLVFLAETKARESRLKGVRNKIGYTQGITVPSDGRSGGLALMWREGTDIDFKGCSNSHIDVVVNGVSASTQWRATGFYGNPDARTRFISWQLLEILKEQSTLPWIVFGDFNEILHPGEKIGGLDRDAKQMEDFRECLSRCGLLDLGFFGQHHTWCNGRFGSQRTKLRLDRMVANEAWTRIFPQARIQHVSLSISDHCLLVLSIKRRLHQKPAKKRFFFEEMWTREDSCREIVESAWDPLRVDPEFKVTDRIKSCQI